MLFITQFIIQSVNILYLPPHFSPTRFTTPSTSITPPRSLYHNLPFSYVIDTTSHNSLYIYTNPFNSKKTDPTFHLCNSLAHFTTTHRFPVSFIPQFTLTVLSLYTTPVHPNKADHTFHFYNSSSLNAPQPTLFLLLIPQST